ncbi:MAG: hypothetical protein ACYDC6_07140 [Acidobacteriaceae bacterium]
MRFQRKTGNWMTCQEFQAFLPDMLLDPVRVPVEATHHLTVCHSCECEWKALQSTAQLLDDWQTAGPSPYFATRLEARLREEKETGGTTWLERVRMHLMLRGSGGTLQMRPVVAGAFALLLIVSGGSYAGFFSLNRTVPKRPAVSATVKDLELLDSNAQTLQQLAAFEDPSVDSSTATKGAAIN